MFDSSGEESREREREAGGHDCMSADDSSSTPPARPCLRRRKRGI